MHSTNSPVIVTEQQLESPGGARTQSTQTQRTLEMARMVFDSLDVSEPTRLDYQSRIYEFLNTIDRRGICPDSFLKYKRGLADRTDIAVSTKNKYLTTARVFLRELHRLGHLPIDITANVRTFSQSKHHKKQGISDNDMAMIAATIRSLEDTPENLRLRALLALLSLQGLRQIEISRLDVSDIELPNKRAWVRGKGRDDKEPISLHPETIRAIADYLTVHSLADGPLFRGYSNNSRRLTTRGIRFIVKSALETLCIDKGVHGFRHYFTTKLIRAYGGDLLQVAQYTRHKSLEMLQVYNDNIIREADLPRFYETFEDVDLG